MTDDSLATALRGLYAAHEHLAEASVPERLADEVRREARARRSWGLVGSRPAVALGVAAAAALLIVGAVTLRPALLGSERMGRPAATGPLATEVGARLVEVERLLEASPDALPLAPGEAVRQVGDWESVLAENNKLALSAGAVELGDVRLPTAAATADATAPDGTRHTVPVLTASDAARVLSTNARDCGGCRPLRVTGAHLETVTARGAGGSWTVPAWMFDFEGTTVRAAVIALGPAQRLVLPERPAPGARRLDRATIGADGTTLTLHFVGAQAGACAEDYDATFAESDRAVVVAVSVKPPTASVAPDRFCAEVGYPRTVTVQLSHQLGSRPVVDLQGGIIGPDQDSNP